MGLPQIGVNHLRVVAHVGIRPFSEHAPALEDRDTIREFSDDAHIVLDQHDRPPRAHLADQRDDATDIVHTHPGGRFVEEEETWFEGEDKGQKANEFYDRNQADIILDVPTSSCGLAVAAVSKAKKKLYINVGSATTELNGAQCNKYTFHYAYDTYMLANGTAPLVTKNVGKKWYLVYPDYAFGQDMVKSFTDAITKSGGTVVGTDPSPFPSSGDFSSYLLKAQSAKPDIVGSMHAGGDVVNFAKQYNEFKLRDQKISLAIGLLFDSDIKALGPDAFQGISYTTAWLWTLDDQSRAWADMAKKVIGVRPTFAHAGNYSAAWQYMDAVRRAGTDDPDAVVKELEGYQFTDFFARNATIRKEDHALIHDVYTAQVKPLKENSEEGDYSKILGTTPGKDAFKADGATSCTMSA